MKRQLTIIYLYEFLSTFILFYICDTLYYLESGITSSGYIIFVAISFFIQLLLEIPSGIIADKYNKKIILLVSELLFIISTIIFIYLKAFYWFIIAIIIKSVSACLTTGIINSMLYEIDNSKFNKLLFFKQLSFNISYMLAMIIGGYIGSKYGLIYTYKLTLIPACINLIVICLLKNNKCYNKEKKNNVLKNAITEIKCNKQLLDLIFTSAIIFSSIKLLEESHPEYSSNIGISVFVIGIYTSLILLFCIFGNFLGVKLGKKNKEFILKYNSLFVGVILLLIGIVNNLSGILFILIIYLFSESYDNVYISELHNNISSKSRVTVESIQSMIICFVGIVFSIFISILLKYMHVHQSYIVLGSVCVIYSLIRFGVISLNKNKFKINKK